MATADDRTPLLTAVKEALDVPIVGGIADGRPLLPGSRPASGGHAGLRGPIGMRSRS